MNAVIPGSIGVFKTPCYKQGYVDLPNAPSGTGSELLVDNTKTTVVRIGADPAFDHFVMFVQTTPRWTSTAGPLNNKLAANSQAALATYKRIWQPPLKGKRLGNFTPAPPG